MHCYADTDAIAGQDVAQALNENPDIVFKTLVTVALCMKKNFVTTIDKSALNFDTIMFSAGKIGYQVQMSLEDLKKVIKFSTSDITSE